VTTSKVEGGIHAELKIIEVPRHGSSVQKKGNEERATTLFFPSLDGCMLIYCQDLRAL
jgi:hypothetical protein